MDIYIIDENEIQMATATGKSSNTYHLPVNPLNNLSNSTERRYKTADIINYGEIDVFKIGDNIEEISFNTLFPLKYDSSFCRDNNLIAPNTWVSKFKKWQKQESPIRLIITDIDINMLATVAKFTSEHRTGEVGDIYANITFRSYREAKIETINTTSSSSGQQLNSRSGDSTINYSKGNKVKVTASMLNVREGPGTTYKTIGNLSKGKQVEVYQSKNDWIEIYFGNHGGWISADYLTKV